MYINFIRTTNGSKYVLFFIFIQLFSHNFLYFNLILENIFYLVGFVILFLFSIFYNNFHYESLQIDFKKIKIKNLFLSLIFFFPLLLFFVKIYDADFNWGGDYRDNIIFSLVNTKFWLTEIFSDKISNQLSIKELLFNFYNSRILNLIIFLTLIIYFHKKNYGNLTNIIAFVIIFLWSKYEIIPISFGIKDPQGSYFINIFSNLIFYIFDLNLLDTLRLSNLLSIFLWATILRPIFINENIDLKILPFIVFYAWYPQFIYMQVGASTEPWAIIFLFLALENFLKYKFERIFLTIIFLSIGSCFKPQISLFIPIITFFYIFEKNEFSKKISLVFLSCLAIFNTASFSYIREIIYKYWQPIKIENYGLSHFNSDFFDLVFFRLSEIYSLLVVFILCFLILIKNFRTNKKVVLYLSFLFGSFFFILFFNTLPQFIQHILYPRYYVYLFLIIFSFVFLEAYKNIKYLNIFIIIFTMVVYSKDLLKFFNFDKYTAYKLNFSQFDSDPIYLGLNQIIDISKQDIEDKKIKEIYLSRSSRIVYKIPKYLYKHYEILESPRNEIFCTCDEKKRAIINFYPKLRNSLIKYRTNMPTSPQGYGELYGKNLKNSKINCLEKMNNTCSIVHLLKEDDETIIAALGID